jgi:hypothetical protein
MQRISWQEVVLARQTCPDVDTENMPDYISMAGAFDINLPRGKLLPDELYLMTTDIENTVRKSFQELRVVGEESANEYYPQLRGTRYWGNIYGSDNSGVMTRIQISGFETRPPFELETLLEFFAVFPLGNYQAQSGAALQGIWNYISGFDYIIPGHGSIIPEDNQGDQSILLFRNGNPIATGQYAIIQSGLPVDPKPTAKLSRGILI